MRNFNCCNIFENISKLKTQYYMLFRGNLKFVELLIRKCFEIRCVKLLTEK